MAPNSRWCEFEPDFFLYLVLYTLSLIPIPYALYLFYRTPDMKTARQKVFEERIERLKRDNQKLKENLSALKKEKQSILKELKDFRALLKEIPGAVLLVQDGKVVLSNENAWRQLGYTEQEMVGCDLASLLHSRSSEFFESIYRNWASGKYVPDQYEVYMRRKDGRAFCCEVNWRKIRFHKRQAFLLNVMGLDHRKREEKSKRQSQKLNTITRMISMLSRDIRRRIDFFKDLSVQLQDVVPTKNYEVIRSLRRFDAIMEIGENLSHRMNCLTKSENYEADVVLFSPKDVIQDAVAITQPKWQEDGNGRIKINTYMRTISPVEGYPEEMRDAFISIILNAIDALPDGGEIYLTTEENSGFAWIYIQDNGVGIRDDIQDRIFDPFFTTEKDRNTGLGLSLADAIIDRHGGEINVISQEGQGATFIVKLPLSDRPAPSLEKRGTNNIKESKILIITGGNIATDLLTQMFLMKGGKIFSAYSCSEGLKLLRKKKFDLVVADIDTLDFQLAGIVPKIRRMKTEIPIALVNAMENGRSAKIFENLDVDLVIERPMEMDRIALLISDVLEKG